MIKHIQLVLHDHQEFVGAESFICALLHNALRSDIQAVRVFTDTILEENLPYTLTITNYGYANSL